MNRTHIANDSIHQLKVFGNLSTGTAMHTHNKRSDLANSNKTHKCHRTDSVELAPPMSFPATEMTTPLYCPFSRTKQVSWYWNVSILDFFGS